MSVPSQHHFAAVLRQHRQARGLTQADLAHQAHMSRRAIVDLERGASQPHPTTIARLATALRLGATHQTHFFAAANTRKIPAQHERTPAESTNATPSARDCDQMPSMRVSEKGPSKR